jgi:hypothetical protein
MFCGSNPFHNHNDACSWEYKYLAAVCMSPLKFPDCCYMLYVGWSSAWTTTKIQNVWFPQCLRPGKMVWSSKLRMALYAETPDPHSLNSANVGFCYEGIQWLRKLDLTRLQSTQRFENSYAYLLIHLRFFWILSLKRLCNGQCIVHCNQMMCMGGRNYFLLGGVLIDNQKICSWLLSLPQFLVVPIWLVAMHPNPGQKAVNLEGKHMKKCPAQDSQSTRFIKNSSPHESQCTRTGKHLKFKSVRNNKKRIVT